MRRSMKASRNRILAIAASILLSGSAVAAAAAPAQAITLPANKVVVNSPGTQATSPIATAVVPITATESDLTATLSYTVTSVPAGPITITTTTGPDNTTASITGTFTAPYSGQVTVTATAAPTLTSSGGTASVQFTWTAANTIAFPANPGTQTTQVGTAVAGPTITATDNATGATLAYTSATLPPGLAINAATGVITGTPTKRGTYAVTVTATDQTGATASSKFTWKVTPNVIAVKVKAPATAWVGVPVRVQATATDSAPGETVTWTARNLPAGLTISKTTGLISGRPTAARTVTSTVTARDAYGVTGSATVVFRIAQGVIIPNPGAQATTVGMWKILAPIRATDGVPGDRPSYSATGLPAGMGFIASPMLFYGWPSAPGIYRVTIHEQGSRGSISAMTFKLTVKSAPDRGATGQIQLALDGKCLQDPGGRTASGTRVEIGNCVPGATERWTVVSDGTIRVSGRCLDIAGAGSASGRQVQLSGCGNANPRQVWAQGTRGELINPASGLCLTDPGSSRRNGTVATMGACHVKSYEQWTLPAQPVLTALGGSCADDHYSEGNNGAVVDMFWCNGTPGQDWSFRADGTIRPDLYSNKCMTVRGRLGAVGTKIVLWACSSSDQGQKWTVFRTSAVSSELRLGGVCLAIPSMTTARGTLLETNGTQLITSRCGNNDPRDQWHIE